MPDVENLLRQMTLQEKVLMLAGTNFSVCRCCSATGYSCLEDDGWSRWGPRRGRCTGGVKSTFSRQRSRCLTWNTDLVERIGQALAEETKSKGAQVLLGPTVNIQRPPTGRTHLRGLLRRPLSLRATGRGRLTGLQREGIGAPVKHYPWYDAQFERNYDQSEVRERTLREIYLPPSRLPCARQRHGR